MIFYFTQDYMSLLYIVLNYLFSLPFVIVFLFCSLIFIGLHAAFLCLKGELVYCDFEDPFYIDYGKKN